MSVTPPEPDYPEPQTPEPIDPPETWPQPADPEVPPMQADADALKD